jgi:hypothetical protein
VNFAGRTHPLELTHFNAEELSRQRLVKLGNEVFADRGLKLLALVEQPFVEDTTHGQVQGAKEVN